MSWGRNKWRRDGGLENYDKYFYSLLSHFYFLLVFFRRKEITIYPNDDEKPAEGEGLNRRAQVTLDMVWPKAKDTHAAIKDPQRIADMNYTDKIERASAKIGAKFLDYRPETGSWVFEVSLCAGGGFSGVQGA